MCSFFEKKGEKIKEILFGNVWLGQNFELAESIGAMLRSFSWLAWLAMGYQ
jgi:hypothetical protein